MKTLVQQCLAVVMLWATAAQAEQMIIVDGESYRLSHLTRNCQSITDDPAAQIACFGALSRLLEEQASAPAVNAELIAARLTTLQSAAEHRAEDTGLLIEAADCKLHLTYYGNYFHISRRNISTIDVISVSLDAAALDLTRLAPATAGPVPQMQAAVLPGATAAVRGGFGLDSDIDRFTPRAPQMTLDAYAQSIVAELSPREVTDFDFVLVHPARAAAQAEIITAFRDFAAACQG